MKKYLYLLLLCISISAFAQNSKPAPIIRGSGIDSCQKFNNIINSLTVFMFAGDSESPALRTVNAILLNNKYDNTISNGESALLDYWNWIAGYLTGTDIQAAIDNSTQFDWNQQISNLRMDAPRIIERIYLYCNQHTNFPMVAAVHTLRVELKQYTTDQKIDFNPNIVGSVSEALIPQTFFQYNGIHHDLENQMCLPDPEAAMCKP